METEPSSPFSGAIRIVLCLWFLSASSTLSANAAEDFRLAQQVDHVIEATEEVVKERLSLLDQSLMEHRLDDAVRRIIAIHLRYPAKTARSLGRAVAYFPIFEAELAAAGLPQTLKYLPVIESALHPRAMSHVGAEGLWQFMPETAPEYGLLLDDYIDERLDPHAATQGAIRYLQDAYEYLGDWSLAIAAYNAGKGRVRRAQRRSGGKNFWRVRRHLPRETRKYVPAFIAAVYLTEFFAAHEIEPNLPSFDEQLLDRIVVEKPLSFYRIAQVTELPVNLIQRLNPSYIKGYLPAYPGGHGLILPQRVMPAMREYLALYGDAEDEPVLPWAPIFNINEKQDHEQDYQEYETLVQHGDSLEVIAERIQFSPSQLAIWNNLSPLDSLVEGQSIVYYRPIQYHYLPQREVKVSEQQLPHRQAVLASQSLVYRQLPGHIQPQLCVRVAKRQSVANLLANYPAVDEDAFLQLNNWTPKKPLPNGKLVVVPL